MNDIIAYTDDKQRFFFKEYGLDIHIKADMNTKKNKNFAASDRLLTWIEDNPSKELHILFFMAFYSNKHNTVELNSNVFFNAFRFAEVDDIPEMLTRMIHLGLLAIIPSYSDDKNDMIIFNPTFAIFSNTLFEKEHHLFVAMNSLWHKDVNVVEKKKSRYVYFLSGWDNYTKIGKTNDIKSRVSAHSCSNPNSKLLFSIYDADGSTEGRLHKHFKDKRVKLEWFDLTDSDIEWIKSNFKVVE